MERLFTDSSKRIYALYGNTGDYLCTPQLRELDLSSWLLAHLKSLGYRRVVFYSPRKKIHFLDAESAQLAQGDATAVDTAASKTRPGASAAKIKAGPLGFARLPRARPNSASAAPQGGHANIRWDLGAMSDAQAISALERMLCETLPTALVFQNGEDLFDMLDDDAFRHWDDALGDWGGTRLPATSRNLAVLIFRDEIDLSPDRLPRLGKLLFVGDPIRPKSDRAFRVGSARQDEVANLLHRLRLRGDIGWTPAQIARHSLGLAQRLIPDTITDGVKSLGTLSHEVRAMSVPPASDQDPWTRLRQAPGLAARVEQPLRALVKNAKEKLARHAPPPRVRRPLDIERLTIQQQPNPDKLANLHLALLGSPGTGKTTLARLVARIYRDEGILTSGHLVEVSASQLIEEHIGGTAKRTAEAVSRALGGVLFIDEAYSLDANQFGAEAVNELVQAMTQYNGQFAVIIAGYTDQINDFIEGPNANPGLLRRFPADNRWTLTNYDPTELYAIFCHLLTQEEREQDEELRAELPGAFVQWHKAQDPKSFGNAGEIKNLVETLMRAAGDRRLIGKQDFAALPGWRQYLGLQPLPSVSELLKPLDDMVGLNSVRNQLEALCHTLHVAMRRKGSLVGHAPGHYLFTGNPGTGKTTVARIMGAMLYELGLLNKGHLRELSADRLVGDAEKTMREALRYAQDGVLFIDEAHQLAATGGRQSQSAMNVLTPEVENRRQLLCVILAGYPKQLKELLATEPGFLSRFQEIAFDDYRPPELHEIAVRMLAEREMQLSAAASEYLLRLLAFLYAKRGEDFGNARDVRNLIEREILPSQARRLQADLGIPRGDPRLFTIEREDIPGRPDFDPAKYDDAVTGRGITDIKRVLAELDGLVGLVPVKTTIRELTDTLAVQQRRGQGMLAPGHYVFSGNPGTGKTTVARIMGDVFRSLGLLARGHVVEVKREDLVGRCQGDAENNMKERIAAALDGILFVDEAYQLAADEHDIYGRRALETLLASMENHRDRLCVILAGYPSEMQRLLATNPGFKGGRNSFVDFPDYSAEELLAIALGELAKQDYRLTEEATTALAAHLRSWDVRRGQADFGNARDVRNLVGAIIKRQAGRMRPRMAEATDEEFGRITLADIPGVVWSCGLIDPFVAWSGRPVQY